MALKTTAALGLVGVGTTSAGGATPEEWQIASPDGAVSARVVLSDRLRYAVTAGGTLILRASPLGITTESADFTSDLTHESTERRSIRDSYETLHGKRTDHEYEAEELSLTFSTGGQRVVIDIRASEDGVAYRYRLPGNGTTTVLSEASGFQMPSGTAAWLMPWKRNYENQWRETTVSEATGDYSWGSLFEVGGRWALLAESDVQQEYPTTRPEVNADGSTFTVAFPQESVTAPKPLATPWRVVVTGDLNTVVESELVADLASPAEFDNTSWIDPGTVAWSWWSDRSSPSDLETQKQFVDYAAEHDWDHVLVDEGWVADWVPDLVTYADDRDIGIFLWSDWTNLNTDAKREERLPTWADWGVVGVKTDFMDSDTTELMSFYQDLLAAAAEHELMINFHGSTLPKGWRRQWPHCMTFEAVYGAEQYGRGGYEQFAEPGVPASHNVALPFTRNVLGPMDYTPVTFSAGDPPNDGPRETTDGHELALSVVFESGLQHFADDPEVYAKHPAAERLLGAVPATWEETRFVGGHPDSRVTIARRTGEEWFVGTIVTDPASIEIPLSFLPERTAYVADVTTDAEGGGFTAEETTVTRADSVSVDVPEYGGFTVHLHDPVEMSPAATPEPTESTGKNSPTETTVEDSPTETSSDGQPGFEVVTTLTALAGGVLAALRRASRRD
jgi:PGF-CTERM protein